MLDELSWEPMATVDPLGPSIEGYTLEEDRYHYKVVLMPRVGPDFKPLDRWSLKVYHEGSEIHASNIQADDVTHAQYTATERLFNIVHMEEQKLIRFRGDVEHLALALRYKMYTN